jgi:hypothetical protein
LDLREAMQPLVGLLERDAGWVFRQASLEAVEADILKVSPGMDCP